MTQVGQRLIAVNFNFHAFKHFQQSMTLETSFETGRDLLFWSWPLSTVTPFLKHGVRQPLKSVKSFLFVQCMSVYLVTHM